MIVNSDGGWIAAPLCESLSDFDWSMQAPAPRELEGYRAFYSLPGDDLALHQIGWQHVSNHRVVVQVWQVAEPRGSVFMVHGYYDHVGLYGRFIRCCLEHGFNLVTFDLPGHGLSEGEPATIDSFEDYERIADALYRQASAVFPGLWLAAGQSTGGAILASWLLRGRLVAGESGPDRVLLMAPLLRPMGWSHGRLLHAILRWLIKRLRRRFSLGGNNPEFSRFLAEQDPLQSRYLSVRWVTAMKNWIHWIEAQPSLVYPVTLVQGSADQTVDWQYNLPMYHQLFPSLQIEMLDGGHHHLVNETAERWTKLTLLWEKWLNNGIQESF
jgi:alpha-beta hydrolase superfamily lysophospholipase